MKRLSTVTLATLLSLLTLGFHPAAGHHAASPQRPPRPIRDSDDPPGPIGRINVEIDHTPGTEYVYPVGLRPTPQDVDADGIPDAVEQQMLDKFAPTFAHDSRETHYPAAIEDYLPQVALMFRHKGCDDHVVLGLGQVNTRSLLRQTHPVGCQHTAGSRASNAPIKGEEFFYMFLSTCTRWTTHCQREARDNCAGNPDPKCQTTEFIQCIREQRRLERELIRRGETLDPGVVCEDIGILRGYQDLNRLRAYAAVRPSGFVRNGYNIFVRVFYPVSALEGSFLGLVGPFGKHAADWEGVSMHVTGAGELVGVTYNAHGEKTFVPAAQVVRDPADNVRPLVFVAAKSHAMYPTRGQHARNLVEPTDYHYGDRFIFPTRGRILNVGRTGRAFPGFEWTEYAGPWGEDWNPSDILGIKLEGASPKTPTF
ncbi:MAG TPA: Vps62-related protein [Pyrinomonadaceae bacterium]|nr:Vps62-related protein [Pyrinomonadaceae bacterium]